MAFTKKTETKATVVPKVEPTEDAKAKAERELHEAAVHHVKNQHGPYVNRLRNYDELVEDAKNQIGGAIEANKTF